MIFIGLMIKSGKELALVPVVGIIFRFTYQYSVVLYRNSTQFCETKKSDL